ncbi:BLUF domain-containing protein [Hydrogenophaga sp. ZJX-1]|uniref:BLUF domain-containing protein n=1 Tax=Hydrogenophaga sp. ZJX-1 TaxID=3404778 RepID=UPI003B282E8B
MSINESDQTTTDWPGSGSDVPTLPVGRLVYASVCLVQEAVLDEMRRIRDHALVNNGPQGIRVALLYMSGWFVEWMEGPEGAIQALLQRVAQDSRHQGIKVIHRSVGRPRLFRPWIGAIVQTPERPDAFGMRVFEQLDRFESGQVVDPASVWLALCSPAVTAMPTPLGQYPRIMLLSARGARAFDLITWLASVHQQPLVRRRFAGAADDAHDVESDYLDLPAHGQQGLRLIANARKGLAMGMTHAFLPDYTAVVVLLDQDATANQRIVDRVLAACRQVHHLPTIVGLGTPAELTTDLMEQVERQGLAWCTARTRTGQPELGDYWGALLPALNALE